MKNILLLIGVLSAFVAQAQTDRSTLHPIRVDVVYLASDYLEGRETGTNGEILAAEYISQRFEELGLQPAGTGGAWYQPFDFKVNANPHASADEGESRTGRNVVAFMDNGAENTVVIGAHYDHLGHGGHGSLDPNSDDIHNGADDNASGIAAILHIAKRLQQGKAKANNYLFIAFSGEEFGLFGSKAWVNNPTKDLSKINYMINLDMVGRLKADKSIPVSGTGTSPAWDPSFEALKDQGIRVQGSPSGIGPSDHTSFYLKDIPVLHFFTGTHTDYHKPSDDSPLVNFEGIVEIADYIVALVEHLDDQGKLEFRKTKNEQEGRKVSAFKVSLGVMPDYAHQDKGMRIDAVIDGRPASKAGLEDGDVIVELGGMEVGDIYDYMEALSKFKAGETAEVVVKRGKKKVKKKVKF